MRSTKQWCRSASILLCMLGLSAQAQPRRLPHDFLDFPAEGVFSGRRAALQLSRDDLFYRTRLRQAARQRPNFARHYVVSLWGCGAQCMMGAVIDVRTGRVRWLPATVSDWFAGGFSVADWGASLNTGDFRPVDFRVNSTLLVFNGRLNENGPMARHYFFLGKAGRFEYLTTEPMPDPHGRAGADPQPSHEK